VKIPFSSAVHPHACGEHYDSIPSYSPLVGSSPRMWGTPINPFSACAVIRFIPTHVGNTDRWVARVFEPGVHPHACGEHSLCRCGLTGRAGSSPRMWGTHDGHRGHEVAGRFIPTHVGNTYTIVQIASIHTVHPHACGEHEQSGMTHTEAAGSSPRMWGTLYFQALSELPYRFIPTHMGNTNVSECQYSGSSVHPHACGEH